MCVGSPCLIWLVKAPYRGLIRALWRSWKDVEFARANSLNQFATWIKVLPYVKKFNINRFTFPIE